MSQSRRDVVEFIVPYLIERNWSVNRSHIHRFLKHYDVKAPEDFRREFDHPDGMMNNFCRIYGETP